MLANQPLFICQPCCANLKSTYNFRKMSMKNARTFRGYICQLTNVAQDFPNGYFDVNIEISNYDMKKCYYKSKKLLNRDTSKSNSKNNNSLLTNSMNKMKIKCDNQNTANVNDNLKVDLHIFEDKYSNLLANMDDTNVSTEQFPINNITNCNTVGLQEFPASNDENPDEHSDHLNDPKYEEFMAELRSIVSAEMRERNSKTERNIDSSVDNPQTFSSTVDDFDEQIGDFNFDFETFAEMQQNDIRSEISKNNVTLTDDAISRPVPSSFETQQNAVKSEIPKNNVTSTDDAISKPASSSFKHYSKTGTSRKTKKCSKIRYIQYCNICNKHLSGNFQRHLLIHSGVKPYKCQECSRTFVRRDHLKSHMHRWHDTNEKKSVTYKCFECGKTYNYKKSLTSHLKTHNHLRLKNDEN